MQPPTSHGDSSLRREADIDTACDHFESEWRAGRRPRIEDFLTNSGGQALPRLLRELLRIEREYRRNQGEHLDEQEYRDRFAGQGAVLDELFGTEGEQLDRTGPYVPGEPASWAWVPGDVIAGLYEVREVFTGGGMGLVYRVRHRAWNIDLAVKCPRAEYFRDEHGRNNFEREAETWVKLGLHPHTVSCHYVRRLDGIPDVFAEFVEGGSLRDWIRSGRLYAGGPDKALERILDVAIQFAWGLDHAHGQGLVHQDIKPANVLLTPEGVAKVTDFGLARARAFTAEAATGCPQRSVLVSVGGMTPAYSSPEQARGESVSRKTDIWSWAVSVLEMFTGRVTWRVGSAAHKALEDYLATPTADARLPQMPPVLAAVLRRCFHLQPTTRPADMPEVVQALQGAYRQATRQEYPRPAPHPAELLAESLNNQALSLLDLGKQEEAEKVWANALQAHPDHPEAVYNLGLIKWRTAQLTEQELLQRLTKVCSSHAGNWVPLYLLAQVHLERGDREAASATLGQIGEADATGDEVRVLVAQARNQLSRSHRLLRTFEGHTGSVNSVCLTADRRYALSGGSDKTLKLWEVETGRCLRTFEGHAGPVNAVYVSADGRYALSGSGEMILRERKDEPTPEGYSRRLWLETGTNIVHHENDKPMPVDCLMDQELTTGEESPSRPHLFGYCTECTVRLWDVATGQCLRTFEGHTGQVNSVCLSPDGLHALSGGGFLGSGYDQPGQVFLWEVATGRCLRAFGAFERAVQSVCLSADGLSALVGSWDTHRGLTLWDVPTGRCLRTIRASRVNAVALSTDGCRALLGDDYGRIALWDVTKAGPPRSFKGRAVTAYNFGATAVHLSADDRHALSGSFDNTLKLWDVATGRCLRTLEGHADSVRSVCLSRDGQYALSGSEDGTLKLWSVAEEVTAPFRLCRVLLTEQSVAAENSFRKALQHAREALARGDAVVAARSIRQARAQPGHGRLQEVMSVWGDLYLRLPRTTFKGGWEQADDPNWALMRASPLGGDERYVLSESREADRFYARPWQVTLSDVASGRALKIFTGGQDRPYCACMSPDGQHALVGSGNLREPGVVYHWEVASHRLCTFQGHALTVRSVQVSADGRFVLSGSEDRTLKLWEAATGRCLHTLEGHTGSVYSVCLSKDGRYAVSGSGDKSVKLWDLAAGRCILQLDGHTGAVFAVCLSRDGRLVVSGSLDGTLKVWDLPAGRCLHTLEGHRREVWALCLSEDGRHALSGGNDTAALEYRCGHLKIWELETGRCLCTLEGHTDTVHWVCLSGDGSRALSTGWGQPVKLWTLDWELEEKQPADWDEEARPYLEMFLGAHTPPAASLPGAGWLRKLFGGVPLEEQIALALIRRGEPVWTPDDFLRLLHTLGCAGYGWLRPEGVRRELEKMATDWQGPKSLFATSDSPPS
jgi:WD40 repeat protein/serine/threonine protein kinase